MDSPIQTVSVIVPCYNYGIYLREALESIARQSVKAHEIIIVSDGAIDNSVEIAKQFKTDYPDQNVIIIEKENGGLASARNAGIKIATGKYIMSFDSDDILRPDALKEHLKIAGDNTVVTCGLTAFGSQNYSTIPSKADLKTLLQRNVIYSNSVYPRDLALKVGLFDESKTMRLGLEDWEMWIRMAESGAEFKTSMYSALLWRQHGNNMSTSSANPNWDTLMKYFRNKHNILYSKYNLI